MDPSPPQGQDCMWHPKKSESEIQWECSSSVNGNNSVPAPGDLWGLPVCVIYNLSLYIAVDSIYF